MPETNITYKGLQIKISKDGRAYRAYEETPIFKHKVDILSGCTCEEGFYTLEAVTDKIDTLYKEAKEKGLIE